MVNLCVIDLSKAFDKVNHHAVSIKLMKRYFVVKVVYLIENMCSSCYSFVKWYNVWLDMFRVDFGLRHLFPLYLEDLSDLYLRGCAIVLYADDILLTSILLCQLQKLFHICEKELFSPLSKLDDRAIYFACDNFFFLFLRLL